MDNFVLSNIPALTKEIKNLQAQSPILKERNR